MNLCSCSTVHTWILNTLLLPFIFIRYFVLPEKSRISGHTRQSIAAISAALTGTIVPSVSVIASGFRLSMFCICWHCVSCEHLKLAPNFGILSNLLFHRLFIFFHGHPSVFLSPAKSSFTRFPRSIVARVASHQIAIFTMTSQKGPRITTYICCKTDIDFDRREIRRISFRLHISDDGLP